jgi:hypothetical protein
LLVIIPFILISCFTVTNSEKVSLNLKNKNIIILPFENYTETPLAALRLSSIAYGVFSSKGYNVKIYNDSNDKDYKPEEIKTLI